MSRAVISTVVGVSSIYGVLTTLRMFLVSRLFYLAEGLLIERLRKLRKDLIRTVRGISSLRHMVFSGSSRGMMRAVMTCVGDVFTVIVVSMKGVCSSCVVLVCVMCVRLA